MKKLSKICSIKILILSQLLLGSLCIPAHADWIWHVIGEMKSVLKGTNHTDAARELEDIVQWTVATNRIAAEIARITSDPEAAEETQRIKDQVLKIEQNISILLQKIWNGISFKESYIPGLQREAKAARDNFRAALELYHNIQTASKNIYPIGTGYW